MPKPLILIHDGAIDEFMSVALLTGPDFREQYDLLGVIVTNADTIGRSAVEVTQKILICGHMENVPVGLSKARGWNPFPWVYRQFPLTTSPLPILNPGGKVPPLPDSPDGDDLLDQLLTGQDDNSVTILITCPFTTLTDAFAQNPSLESKIESVIWMGGALNVSGNIDLGIIPGGNTVAEWNSYWDPIAVDAFFQTSLPLTVFPLDVTNEFPINSDWIIEELGPYAENPMINLAANAYSQVVPQGGFCLWDVVTTIYLTRPDLFGREPGSLEVVLPPDVKQGQLITPANGGREVTIATYLHNHEKVRDYAIQQWAAV